MTKLFVLGTLMCLFTACSNRKVPGSILAPKEMQSVLWDMMRADNFVLSFILPRDSSAIKKIESIKQYEQILAIHQLTKDNFLKSFNYYKSHPELMRELMDSIQKQSQKLVASSIDEKIDSTPRPIQDTGRKPEELSPPMETQHDSINRLDTSKKKGLRTIFSKLKTAS